MPDPTPVVVTWMPTEVTFPYVLTELQCIGEGEMYVQALAPPYAVTYEVISGEWPPGLTMSSGGQITGIIDMNEVSAPAKAGVPPEGFRFNETNYLKHHVSGVTLEFTVRGTVASIPPVTSDFPTTMSVRTNWSARRDKLILNINNQFFLNGKAVDNQTYLDGKKAEGNFPGPEC